MATKKTIIIPDGKTEFIHLVDTENVEVTMTALASFVPNKMIPVMDDDKPLLDEDEQPIMKEKYTIAELAVLRIEQLVNNDRKIFLKNQRRIAAASDGSTDKITVEKL